jgi:hypothetical protein
MNKKIHFLLLTSLTLLVMVISTLHPMIARADDSTPSAPATQPPAAVATQPPAADTSVAPADTSALATSVAPADTSVAPADTSAQSTDTSDATAAPATTDTTVVPTDTMVAPTDTSTLVGSVPTGTSVVVEDATGTPVPLATQAAADIVKTGDPQFCTSSGYCGASETTIAAAIEDAYAYAFSAGVTGSINVAAGTFNENVSILGSSFTAGSGYTPDTFKLIGAGSSSTSLNGYISISDMNAFTLQGFTISGATSNGTYVSADSNNGTLTIQDVNVTNSTSNNNGYGIYVHNHKGDIHLSGVNSSNNKGFGAYLDNTLGTGSITVDGNSQFSNNGMIGLEAISNGEITLNNVTADKNTGEGAWLDGLGTGSITVEGYSKFNGNTEDGLDAFSTGEEITLNNMTADGNDYDGAYLDNCMYDGDDCTILGESSLGPDVNVSNSTFGEIIGDAENGNGSNGLEVYSAGNVTLTKVTADDNSFDGAKLGDPYDSNAPIWGDMKATGGDFSYNYGGGESDNPAGLEVYAYGNIQLSDGVTASYNGFIEGGPYADGAYLDNSGIDATGTINITSSTFNNNTGSGESDGYGRGLVAHSNNDITLTDVTASDNSAGGAELDNCHDQISFPDYNCTEAGNGSIYLLGNNNTFNDNGFNLAPSVGLFATSNYDITLNGVTALGNGALAGGGAYLDAGRDLSITSSVFKENCTMCFFGFGLNAESGGNTSLEGVAADSNGTPGGIEGVGADIYSVGDITIANSDFSENLGSYYSDGLNAASDGEITLTSVIADSNTGDGADLSTGLDPTITNSHFDNNGEDGLYVVTNNADVTINCSTANGNFGYDLDGGLGSGTLTLNGVTFDSNNISSDTLVINPGSCHGGGKSAILGESGSLPWNVVNVPDSSGQGNPLSCSQYVGTDLVLPNGDHALLPCPIGSTPGTSGSLRGLSSNKLPGTALDSRFTFVSAFDVEVTPSMSGGTITVSFKIPAGKQGANFTILHWDGTKWVKMGGSTNPPGYFSVTTSLTGDFVLVTQ